MWSTGVFCDILLHHPAAHFPYAFLVSPTPAGFFAGVCVCCGLAGDVHLEFCLFLGFLSAYGSQFDLRCRHLLHFQNCRLNVIDGCNLWLCFRIEPWWMWSIGVFGLPCIILQLLFRMCFSRLWCLRWSLVTFFRLLPDLIDKYLHSLLPSSSGKKGGLRMLINEQAAVTSTVSVLESVAKSFVFKSI